jgi:hypothetical protein
MIAIGLRHGEPAGFDLSEAKVMDSKSKSSLTALATRGTSLRLEKVLEIAKSEGMLNSNSRHRAGYDKFWKKVTALLDEPDAKNGLELSRWVNKRECDVWMSLLRMEALVCQLEHEESPSFEKPAFTELEDKFEDLHKCEKLLIQKEKRDDLSRRYFSLMAVSKHRARRHHHHHSSSVHVHVHNSASDGCGQAGCKSASGGCGSAGCATEPDKQSPLKRTKVEKPESETKDSFGTDKDSSGGVG